MELYLPTPPKITVATNTFINVPVILKYESIPLLEVVKVVSGKNISFTTQISIFHSDGTYLAKIKGNRPYPTKDGKKAGITTREAPGKYICSLGGKEIFELSHGVGDAFKANAELFTPDGYLVRCSDNPSLSLFDLTGNAIKIGGNTLIGNTFTNKSVGIWLRKDGSLSLGVS